MIPSRVLLHFGAAHLIGNNKNEGIEILKLYISKCPHAKQFGKDVVLNTILLHGPKKQSNDNKKNTKKQRKTNYHLMSLLAFKKTKVQFCVSTTIQSTKI